MKKYKLFIILIIISLLLTSNTYWEAKTMSEKKWFDLYQERVSLFCSEYKINDNSSETIYLIDSDNQFLNLDNPGTTTLWYELWKDLELAKKQYRKNMDEIYWCSTNIVYYRSLKLIKNDLITKNPKLNSRLQNKLNFKIKEIENDINQNSTKCKITWEKNNSIIKKSVLKQTTYEFCKYSFYLEYLKEINEKIWKLDSWTLNNSDNNKAISEVLKKEKTKKLQINEEIENINKIFPVAFKAYSEYENNITNHILLELLREDYNLLRESLHKTINPINQVVYKISNAMRK